MSKDPKIGLVLRKTTLEDTARFCLDVVLTALPCLSEDVQIELRERMCAAMWVHEGSGDMVEVYDPFVVKTRFIEDYLRAYVHHGSRHLP